MKKSNRSRVLVSFLILVFCHPLFSGEETEKTLYKMEYSEKAVKNYSEAMKIDNEGVVESAIFYSVKLKLLSPELDTKLIEKQLKELILDGATERIRYKAQIALTFISNPAMLANIEQKNYQDNNDELFRNLADELEDKFLVNR